MSTPVSPTVGQIAYVVSDVARAKRFFVEAIGLEPLFDAGPNLTFVGAGGVRLMLTTPQGHGTPGQNSILYFKTHGIEARYAESIAKGAKAERPAQLTARLPDHELWIAFIRDPDGNLIGWMEERR